MGCSTSLVKYLVFFFNLIFVLASLALIGFGVYAKLFMDDVISREHTRSAATEKAVLLFQWAPVAIIVVGVIIFIISFLGCCGAIRENNCMLTTFAVVLLILFAVQTAFGIYLIVEIKREDGTLTDIFTNLFDHLLQDYRTDNLSRDIFDTMQESIYCCGVHGPRDWQRVGFQVETSLPKSCCIGTDICSIKTGDHWGKGCVDQFLEKGALWFTVLGGALILLAIFELIGAVLVCCLTNSIRNAERRGVYA